MVGGSVSYVTRSSTTTSACTESNTVVGGTGFISTCCRTDGCNGSVAISTSVMLTLAVVATASLFNIMMINWKINTLFRRNWQKSNLSFAFLVALFRRHPNRNLVWFESFFASFTNYSNKRHSHWKCAFSFLWECFYFIRLKKKKKKLLIMVVYFYWTIGYIQIVKFFEFLKKSAQSE